MRPSLLRLPLTLALSLFWSLCMFDCVWKCWWHCDDDADDMRPVSSVSWQPTMNYRCPAQAGGSIPQMWWLQARAGPSPGCPVVLHPAHHRIRHHTNNTRERAQLPRNTGLFVRAWNIRLKLTLSNQFVLPFYIELFVFNCIFLKTLAVEIQSHL